MRSTVAHLCSVEHVLVALARSTQLHFGHVAPCARLRHTRCLHGDRFEFELEQFELRAQHKKCFLLLVIRICSFVFVYYKQLQMDTSEAGWDKRTIDDNTRRNGDLRSGIRWVGLDARAARRTHASWAARCRSAEERAATEQQIASTFTLYSAWLKHMAGRSRRTHEDGGGAADGGEGRTAVGELLDHQCLVQHAQTCAAWANTRGMFTWVYK